MEYKEFFDTSIVGIIKISYEQVIMDCNPAFSDFVGIPRKRIIGKSWKQITSEKWHDEEIEIFKELQSNGFAREYVKEFIRSNGTIVEGIVNLWAVFDGEEISSYFWGSVKSVETTIQETQSQNLQNIPLVDEKLKNNFDYLLNNISLGICYLNSKYEVSEVNQQFLDILQIPRNSILNKQILKIFIAGTNFSEIFWSDIAKRKSYLDKVKLTKQKVYVDKEVNDRHFKVVFIPLSSELSNNEILITIEDITEIFELEKRLRQSQKMESIGTLTGGIAHDFNNILSGIIGYAELLKWIIPKGSSGYEETMGILTASNRAKDLISQLLAFSRKQESRMATLSITTILKEIIRLLRSSLPSNIEIYTDYPSDTWNIKADPSQIHQILMNLCINAQHAMPNGGSLRILIQNVNVDEQFIEKNKEAIPGQYVCLVVQDTGIGMDEDVKSKIFITFFTTKPKGMGTGLGLSTVASITKIMRGFICVDSEKGKGSTFSVYFPAVFEDSEEKIEMDEYLKGGNEVILFADDEPSIIQIAISLFKNFGYKTIPAYNGEEALELYKHYSHDIDIVITDLTMPKLSGIQLAKEILIINPKSKIILCSGFASSQIIKSLKEIGVKEFIQKPLVASSVLNSVRRVLDGD
jgi:PAS domain S-box-containing protein